MKNSSGSVTVDERKQVPIASRRLEWKKPLLIPYGSVGSLTMGSGGTQVDGSMTNKAAM